MTMEKMVESQEEAMVFDDAMVKHVGGFGRFQKQLVIVYAVLTILSGILSAEVVFSAAKPKFWCVSGQHRLNISHDTNHLETNIWQNMSSARTNKTEPQGGVTNLDQCVEQSYYNTTSGSAEDGQIKKKCTAWEYDTSQYKSTIVTEFNLVCDRHMMVPLVKSLTLAGKTAGGIFGGFFSDRYGRRVPLLACVFILPMCRIAEMFVPSFVLFAVAYFVRCSFLTVLYLNIFIFMTEVVGPSQRAFVGTLAAAFFSVGYIVLSGVAFLIRERWILQVVNTLPVLFGLFFFIIPESPRWHYAKGRKKQGLECLQKIAKINGRQIPEDLDIYVETEVKGKSSIGELFGATVIVRMVIMIITWFTATIVYYGLTLNIDEFAGNVYLNTVIMGLVEILGCFASQFFMSSCLGRRLSGTITFFIAGLPLLGILLVPQDLSMLGTALAMIGKFGIAGAYNVVYILCAELFPTTMRGMALSVANTTGKIGGAIAPFAWKLALVHPAIPLSIFGASSVASGLICLILPETRGKPLPQSIRDMEKQNKTAGTAEEGEEERMETIPA